MQPKISAIVALGKDTRAICKGPDLLWRIPEDLRRVRDITFGHTLVMGRKTYDSIGHPLKNRVNIVVTRNEDYKPPVPPGYEGETVIVVNSSDEAVMIGREQEIEKNPNNPELFIFGGGEIYEQTLKYTDKLYLTLVDDNKTGTSHFPEYRNEFQNILSESDIKDFNGIPYQWVDLERTVNKSGLPRLSEPLLQSQ